jgi:TolA-binding protein
LFKGGNSAEAKNEFRSLQQKYPKSEYADKSLYLIGWITFQQNNYKGAIDNYMDVINAYPATSLKPAVYYSIGDCYYNMGLYDSAIVNYQRVLAEFPTSNYVFDGVNGIQYSYLAQGKPEKAVFLINDFVARNSKLGFSDKLFFKRGEIYYSQRDYDKAKSSYKEFIVNFPNSPLVADAWYWTGKSSENLGQNDEALQLFSKVIDGYPGKDAAASAVLEMGIIYNTQKKYDAALAVLNKGIDKLAKSSRLPEIMFMKATTLVNKGDINLAYEVFGDIVQTFNGNIFAEKSKIEIGLVELAARRYDNAEAYFKSLSDTRNDELGAKAQYYLGVLYSDESKYPEAVTALVRVRTVFSAYDEWLTRSYLKLGDVYVDMKDYTNAKEMFKIVYSKHKGDAYGQEAQIKLRTLR